MGARSVASGVGPLLFSALFSWFTREESPGTYFPGAPFVLAAALIALAMLAALCIPAPARADRAAEVERPLLPEQLAADERAPLPAEAAALLH